MFHIVLLFYIVIDEDSIAEKNSEFTFTIDQECIKELGGEDDDSSRVEIDEVEQLNHAAVAKDDIISCKEVIEIDGEDDDSSSVDIDEAAQTNHAAVAKVGITRCKEVIEIDGEDDNSSSVEIDEAAQKKHTVGTKVDATSNKEVIQIDDSDESDSDSKSISGGNDNNDGDDNFDQMDAYYNRVRSDCTTLQQNGKSDINNSCCSNSFRSNESDDPYEELQEFAKQYELRESSDGLEINVNANPIDHGAVARNKKKAVIGPQGKTRKLVIKALKMLSGKIHKSTYARSVETRTNARVPIVCVSTCLGFDGDIAVGGHNGTDTSHYMRKQVERYEK